MTYGPGRAELALALHALGAESTSGVSAAIDLADGSAYAGGCGARSLAYLDLDVTAASGMGPVSSSGTTPPTISLSGTPTGAVSLVVQCLTTGALGAWTGQWSADGGATWTAFTSAASVVLGSTGLTMAIATGNAAIDNVWTASTPSLAITMETSRDGAIWRPTSPLTTDANGQLPPGAIGVFDLVAVVGWQRRAIHDLERYVRARWTITGTGAAFTFALSGSALLIYAGLHAISSLAMRAGALSQVTSENAADAEIAASDMADQKLGPRYQLPLVSWPMSVAKHTGSFGAYSIVQAMGYAPQPGARDTFRDAYNMAIEYLDSVFARGDVGIVDQNPPDDFNVGIPDPSPRRWDRGWTMR